VAFAKIMRLPRHSVLRKDMFPSIFVFQMGHCIIKSSKFLVLHCWHSHKKVTRP